MALRSAIIVAVWCVLWLSKVSGALACGAVDAPMGVGCLLTLLLPGALRCGDDRPEFMPKSRCCGDDRPEFAKKSRWGLAARLAGLDLPLPPDVWNSMPVWNS